MSIEGFLDATVVNIQKKHEKLINTPRARAGEELRAEVQEILEYIDTCIRYNDISQEYGNTVKKKIEAIDFENLAIQRKERKRK